MARGRIVLLGLCLALLAALPLSAALRSKYLAAPPLKAFVLAAVAAAVVSIGITNVNFYFRGYATSPDTRTNYAMVQASYFLADLPGDPYVYFYSTQWTFNYEVRRYVAPDVEGEDRSGGWGSEFDLTPRHDRDIVYLFFGSLLEHSAEVERLYPGGQASEVIDNGTILFRAYELPRTADVARELAEPEAQERDEIRRLHLE
ncbi:MAG: hypothetical protein IIB09_09535 [Bacteroidetes bacterium]|nr:hypothetical protein [Bacteroidota bacterium]